MTNMVAILTKLATLGLLKIKLLRNKVHDVIVSVHGVNNKILSHDLKFHFRCGHVTKLWLTLAFL